MNTNAQGIRTVDVKKSDDGTIRNVRIVFGPHHFVELRADDHGKVNFALGATHHGFHADASSVPSELEKITDEVRRLFPGNVID